MRARNALISPPAVINLTSLPHRCAHDPCSDLVLNTISPSRYQHQSQCVKFRTVNQVILRSVNALRLANNMPRSVNRPSRGLGIFCARQRLCFAQDFLCCLKFSGTVVDAERRWHCCRRRPHPLPAARGVAPARWQSRAPASLGRRRPVIMSHATALNGGYVCARTYVSGASTSGANVCRRDYTIVEFALTKVDKKMVASNILSREMLPRVCGTIGAVCMRKWSAGWGCRRSQSRSTLKP